MSFLVDKLLTLSETNMVKPLSTLSKGTAKNKLCMRENYSCGRVIYMGNVQGPEKMNNTCMKTMHAGMMDSGFTIRFCR
jgi:hypothetical protein